MRTNCWWLSGNNIYTSLYTGRVYYYSFDGEKDGSKRPNPRQSEKDIGASLGENGNAQVSFKDGAEVKYGTKDSVRTDWCVGNTCSIEVKKYNLEKNQSGLISNVSDQIVKRSYNLPEGMKQRVVIDIRGQNVLFDQENYIIKKNC